MGLCNIGNQLVKKNKKHKERFDMFGFGENAVEKKVNELEKFVKIQLDQYKENDSVKMQAIKRLRVTFNAMVISIITGAKFDEEKDHEFKNKRFATLPDKDQLSRVMMCVNKYIAEFERKVTVAKIKETAYDTDEIEYVKILPPDQPFITFDDKISTRKFMEIVNDAIPQMLTAEDFLHLELMTASLRKRNAKKYKMWAAGIGLVLVAGVGYYFWRHRDKEEEYDEEDDIDDIDVIEASSNDDLVVTIEDDDAPVVIAPAESFSLS